MFNLLCFLSPAVPCHTAAVRSSWARWTCPWWRQNRWPIRLQQEHRTTTEGLCRGISGTWSACTFLDLEGIPPILRLHREATPVSSSTTSVEQCHLRTFRTEVGILGWDWEWEKQPMHRELNKRMRWGVLQDGARPIVAGACFNLSRWVLAYLTKYAFMSLGLTFQLVDRRDQHTHRPSPVVVTCRFRVYHFSSLVQNARLTFPSLCGLHDSLWTITGWLHLLQEV